MLQKLEFTLKEVEVKEKRCNLSMEEIVKGLDRLILEDNVENQDIYHWVTVRKLRKLNLKKVILTIFEMTHFHN